MTGKAHAEASMITLGDPSQRDGKRNTSDARYSARTADIERAPVIVTLFLLFERAFSSEAVSPSPTITKSACGNRSAASIRRSGPLNGLSEPTNNTLGRT